MIGKPLSKMHIYKSLPVFYSVFFVFLVVSVHLLLFQYAFDDAYIHFRIVRNLWETGTPYYNVSEAVKVSTSTGWTLFLFLFYSVAQALSLVSKFPLIVSIINSFISIFTVFVFTHVIQKIIAKDLVLTSKILIQIPLIAFLLPASIGLMETPLSLLLAGIGIYLLLISRPIGFGVIGLSCYFRLEMLVLLLIVTLFLLITKRLFISHILTIILATIPFLIFDLFFFQTIIPHSIFVKSTVYTLSSIDTTMQIIFSSLPLLPFTLSSVINSIAFLCLVFLTLRVLIQYWRLEPKWALIFFMWGVVVMGGYIINKVFIFEWYVAIYLVPIFTSSILLNIDRRNVIIRGFHITFCVLCSIYILSLVYAGVFAPSKFYNFESGSRVKNYLFVGKILNEKYPDANLMTPEIGGLGYTFKGHVIDAVGLASPEALYYHPMKVPEERISGIIGAIPPDFVENIRPELIVTYDIFAESLLKATVVNEYNLVYLPAYLPADKQVSKKDTIWNGKNLIIFIRNDLPVSAEVRNLGQ